MAKFLFVDEWSYYENNQGSSKCQPCNKGKDILAINTTKATPREALELQNKSGTA